MSKLYIPGVSDGQYSNCLRQLELTDKLLKNPEGNKNELQGIKQLLDQSELGVEFLEAELGNKFTRTYNNLAEACQLKFTGDFILDEHSADNGNTRNQDSWFDYWNNINDGRVPASMGNLYTSFKLIKQQIRQGSSEEKKQAEVTLGSLRKDFKDTWLISSTRLKYEPKSLDATIIQHYRSNKPELVKETNLEIPKYSYAPITKIAGEKLGLNYLQILFDTEDDFETIMQTLEFVSGKTREKIYGWTPSKDWRKSYREQAAGFIYSNDFFRVYGDSIIDYPGRSRGVAFQSSKQTQKNLGEIRK